MITELTPEQEKLIPVYQEKYKQAALCNKPIDSQKAADAIKASYAAAGKKEPEIRFFDSPYSALTFILSSQGEKLRKSLGIKLGRSLANYLDRQLNTFPYSQLVEPLKPLPWWVLLLHRRHQLINQLELKLKKQSKSKLKRQVSSKLNNCVPVDERTINSISCQFLIDVRECDRNQKNWEISKLIAENCGWIFPYENVCLVCVRVACRRLIAPPKYL